MYSVHLHCSAMRGQINSISKLTKRKFLLRNMVTVTIKKKKKKIQESFSVATEKGYLG